LTAHCFLQAYTHLIVIHGIIAFMDAYGIGEQLRWGLNWGNRSVVWFHSWWIRQVRLQSTATLYKLVSSNVRAAAGHYFNHSSAQARGRSLSLTPVRPLKAEG